jgi:hypothetical protein
MANRQDNHQGNRQLNIHVPDSLPMVGPKVGKAMGTSGSPVTTAQVLQQWGLTIVPGRGGTSPKHQDHVAVRKSWPSTELNHCLTAWARGGEQGKELLDKICSLENLQWAFRRVAKNRGKPGIDDVTIHEFCLFLNDNVTTLAKELKSGYYRPQPPNWACIPKPGQ